MTTSTLNN